MQPFVSVLGTEMGLTSKEIADIIWLALQIQESDGAETVTKLETSPQRTESRSQPSSTLPLSDQDKQPDRPSPTPSAEVHHQSNDNQAGFGQLTLQVPDARSLREPLLLARSLKPLLRQVVAGWSTVLDEAATVERIADEQLWLPVLKPALEPWLDLALVVDESVSMQIWQRTIAELQRLLSHYGVFRDMRVWGLMTDEQGQVKLRSGVGATARQQGTRQPSELIDPGGRRLILVATDCVASSWQDGSLLPALKLWEKSGPLAIVQMLPEWLWSRTGLGFASAVKLQSLSPGVPNQQLVVKDLSPWDEVDLDVGIKVPVVTLEPEPFAIWTEMVTGKGGVYSPGFVFEPEVGIPNGQVTQLTNVVAEGSAEQRVQRFRVTASPMARRLAGLLAAAPVISLPVVRIIRDRLLSESRQVHVAEVFLGGLLKPLEKIKTEMHPDSVRYDFLDGVREVLLASVPTSDSINVLEEVSKFVAERLGLSLDAFAAMLRNPQQLEDQRLMSQSRPFAMVTAKILQKLGGEYAQFAAELEKACRPESRSDSTASNNALDDYQNSFSMRVDRRRGRTQVPFVLPKIDVATFTGRLDELGQLKAQLLDANGGEACRIVGLSGAGGVGKSALAFHFATVYRDQFPDGVIGLPVDGKTAREVAYDFARVMAHYGGEGVDEEDERSAATIMQEVFANRRILLIFDNADRADLKVLRPGGQRCALIVTTRDRFLPIAFDVPAQGIIDLPPLPNEDARQLLRRILGTERVDTELDAADRIIEITGGLPLALQIVCSTLRRRQRSLASYAESLQQEQPRLQRLKIRGDNDFNVAACLNLSLESLDDSEIDFFACLSVCAKDGFSLQTAMAAGGLDDEWEAQDLLDRLYQLSLLNEVSQDRYVFHTLVRVYAQELAQSRNLWGNAAHRHAIYFLDLVRSNNVESPETANRIATDFDDILQAAQWLQSNANSDELFDSAIAAFERQIRIAEALNDQQQLAIGLNCLGRLLQLQGKLDEASAAFERQIDIAEVLNDQQQLSIGLNRLGGLLQQQGKLDEASAAFRRQIIIDEALHDQASLAIGLNCLGGLLQQQGKFDEAIAAFKRREIIDEILNDQASLAITLNRLGGLLQQQGKFDEAIVAFERQIGIAETLNDQKQLAIGLNCLGGLLQQQGKFGEAIVAFERQIGIAEALNDQKQLAIGLNCLGGLLQQQGKLDEAIAAFERQITIAEALNEQASLAIGLHCLGGLLQQQGKFDEAVAAFERQVDISEATGDQFYVAIGLYSLGRVLNAMDRIEEAENILQRSRNILVYLKNSKQLLRVLNTLGRVLERKQDWKSAEIVLREGYDLASKETDLVGQAIACNRLGQLYAKRESKDNLSLARMYFCKSIELGKQANDQVHLAKAHTAWGQALINYEMYEDAVVELSLAFDIKEQLGSIYGLKVVTPKLTYALVRLNRQQKALDYCDRAIAATNNDPRLVQLKTKLENKRAVIKLRDRPHS